MLDGNGVLATSDHSYGYDEEGQQTSMYATFGIGLSPLLQWLILPTVMVITFRKLGPVLLCKYNSRLQGSCCRFRSPFDSVQTPIIPARNVPRRPPRLSRVRPLINRVPV